MPAKLHRPDMAHLFLARSSCQTFQTIFEHHVCLVLVDIAEGVLLHFVLTGDFL